VWEIDENGIPDTANPIMIGDDEVSSGGTGDIPGAIDFFHSVMFDNDATVVVDESFGSGCPPTTTWQSRPWNPAGGTHKTGRMFFSDLASEAFLSEFQVGGPSARPGAQCVLLRAHGDGGHGHQQGPPGQRLVHGRCRRDRLHEPDEAEGDRVLRHRGPGPAGSDNWAAYPYQGPRFRKGPGVPIYASDGVHTPDSARGLEVFQPHFGRTAWTFDHLNPQTMD
jgi:hypothetical protein